MIKPWASDSLKGLSLHPRTGTNGKYYEKQMVVKVVIRASAFSSFAVLNVNFFMSGSNHDEDTFSL